MNKVLRESLTKTIIAGMGAMGGSIITALIMTKQCHEMIEDNKEESKEINEKVERINSDVKRAESAFETYKEKVEFADEQNKKMHEGAIEAFRRLADEGKSYDLELKRVSAASVELMKRELKKAFSEVEKEIENSKNNTLKEIENSKNNAINEINDLLNKTKENDELKK